jgi:hypothetical protein
VQITEHELNSGIQQFEGYELGRDLFKELNREHDLLDRDLRPFVEECDHLQGIQLITSSDDAWSGFAAGYLADIRDEYEKIGIITWGLERGERVNKVKSPQNNFGIKFLFLFLFLKNHGVVKPCLR